MSCLTVFIGFESDLRTCDIQSKGVYLIGILCEAWPFLFDRWMSPRRVSLVGWEVSSADVPVGFQPITQNGYQIAKHPSVCELQPQPHPPQLSSPCQRLPQLLDKPPLHPPQTATGLTSVLRKSTMNIITHSLSSRNHTLALLLLLFQMAFKCSQPVRQWGVGCLAIFFCFTEPIT